MTDTRFFTLIISMSIMFLALIPAIPAINNLSNRYNTLFGFRKKNTKTAAAVVTNFLENKDQESGETLLPDTVLQYQNDFLYEKSEVIIPAAYLTQKCKLADECDCNETEINDQILIEYTREKARVIDPSYTKKGQYNIPKYVMPAVFWSAIVMIAFLVFINV